VIGSRRAGALRFAVGLAAMAIVGAARADGPKPLEPPPYGEFLVIPLRVHVLQAADMPEVDCKLSDADLRRVLGKMNGIWHQAGIHWGVESIVREPAARQDEFKKQLDERKGEPGAGRDLFLDLFRMLVPEESKVAEGLHVYYIHKFSVNGVYLGDHVAFVQETARLRPVEGGIDEPLPRVTAHELGHALGLPHRQDRINLLASGNNGTLLNTEEVEIARKVARKTKGMRDILALRKAAEEAETSGDKPTARRLWSTLAEIPGDGAAEARKRLDGLGE
jgi:hypothetical protein